MFYDDGCDAYCNGKNLEDNPHKAGSPEAYEWEQGWHAAYAEDNPPEPDYPPSAWM